MTNKERIIVSMTSYPKRIVNVGKAVYYLLAKQTVKPDEIHIWLAEPEFPNREKDLPEDLQAIIEHPQVFLHWLPKNTYDHKRYEIFKQCNENDLVFIIDDDTYYANNLIETVINVHKQFPNTIICYNVSSKHAYKGKHTLYPVSPVGGPYVNVGRINANSMYPAKIMPKEIYDDEYQVIRDKIVPMCDECWTVPWFVYYDIPMIWLTFGWGTEIDPARVSMNDGFCKTSHIVESNGLTRRDNWLAAVLDAFPKIKEKYEKLFNYGK